MFLGHYYARYGISLYNNKQDDEALPYFQKALEFYPSVFWYKKIVHIHRMQGEYDKAFETINKILQLSENNAFALTSRAFINYSIGKQQEARPDALLAAKQKINDDWLVTILGPLLRLLGEDESSIIVFERGFQLSPEKFQYLTDVAGIYWKNKQFKKAKVVLERVINLGGASFITRYDYVKLLHHLKDDLFEEYANNLLNEAKSNPGENKQYIKENNVIVEVEKMLSNFKNIQQTQ